MFNLYLQYQKFIVIKQIQIRDKKKDQHDYMKR